jgi:hypothetical protein
MIKKYVVSVLMLAASAPLQSQSIVETPQGTLEVIGLRRYTIQSLQDSLSKYAPGVLLQSRACAVPLREALHFPAAAVNISADAKGKRIYTVTIVEPGDSARVSERVVQGKISASDIWKDLRKVAEVGGDFDRRDFAEKLQFYGVALRYGVDSAAARLSEVYDGEELARSQQLFKVLYQKSAEADYEAAVRAIASDPDLSNRSMGAAVLMNFSARDGAWHALATGMRDADNGIRETSRMSIRSLANYVPRRVDWSPATTDLRYLLGGTNVWVYTDVLNALNKTGIATNMAKPLLARNWELLIAHARANAAPFREPAAELLGRLSGISNANPSVWESWAKQLAK